MPVIFLTAFPEEHIRARVIGAGAYGFLSKPFDEDTLIGCLTRALNGDVPGAGPRVIRTPIPWYRLPCIDPASLPTAADYPRYNSSPAPLGQSLPHEQDGRLRRRKADPGRRREAGNGHGCSRSTRPSALSAAVFAATAAAAIAGATVRGESRDNPLDAMCAAADWPMIPQECLVGSDGAVRIIDGDLKAAEAEADAEEDESQVPFRSGLLRLALIRVKEKNNVHLAAHHNHRHRHRRDRRHRERLDLSRCAPLLAAKTDRLALVDAQDGLCHRRDPGPTARRNSAAFRSARPTERMRPGARRCSTEAARSWRKPGSSPRPWSSTCFPAIPPAHTRCPPRVSFPSPRFKPLRCCRPNPYGVGSGRASRSRPTTEEQRSAVAQARDGSCCTAQRLPSGSAKKMNRPHGKS